MSPNPRRIRVSRNKRLWRLLACVLVGAGILVPTTMRTRAAGSMTGVVFQDYNANGTFDVGTSIPNDGGGAGILVATDVGVAGVTVTAYDSGGAVQGTATTAADGTYTLDATGTGPYRIEFTSLPSGMFPSPVGVARTTVRFVPDGNSVDVNLGLVTPADYCQNNPQLFTPCYVFGDQVAGANSGQPVGVSFPYSAGVNGGSDIPAFDQPTSHEIMVPATQIGTTFGVAYSRSTRRIYAGAFFKRHAGFGPGGPGAVYVINRDTDAVEATFTVPGATTDNHDAADFLGDNYDLAWSTVGKLSLGSVAIADDDSRLFVMNVEERAVYALNPADGTVLGSQAVPLNAPDCPSPDDVRPFALTYYRGQLYAGVTCTAESTQDAANLFAYVYQVDPNSLAFGATPVFQFPLNYSRAEAQAAVIPAEWLPWSPTYAFLPDTPWSIYPQPWLTDIGFDQGGNLILGLRDRNGDQVGQNTSWNPADPSDLTSPITAGDILRACGNPTSGWTLETNGSCGGLTTAGADTGQGPDNGEYYYSEEFNFNQGEHDETSMGTVSLIPGFARMVASVFDPIPIDSGDVLFSGGFIWLNHETGNRQKSYRLYPQTAPGTWGKANGLGDIAPLCDLAPIQVGNRVWQDANGNGVQDAGEAPLEGVQVRLIGPDGTTVLGTATTDAEGEYFFSNGPGTNTANSIFNIAGLAPNTPGLRIRIGTGQGPVTGMTLSTGNLGNDNIDSDATLVGANAEVPFGTGPAGSTTHTYDIGFVPANTPIITGVVFIDSNSSGVRDTAETGVGGVTVTAYDPVGEVQGAGTTGQDGSYIINVNGPGPFRVEFTNLPGSYQLGPVGPDNGSTPQNVPSAPAGNVSVGLVNPSTTCGTYPYVAVPCYLAGNVFNPASPQAAGDVLVSLRWGSQGTAPTVNHDVQATQVGSVWGLAWHRGTRKLFSGAFLKRHVALGPLGPGGLYVTDYSAGDPVTTPPTTAPLVDLAALGIDVGTIGPRDLPVNGANPSRDAEAFGLVGRVGLGDLDMSEDGNTLYAINLAERSILRIDMTGYNTTAAPPTAAQVTSIPVPDPDPACIGGVARPFGLKAHGGLLYIGVTCTGELGGTTDDLRGLIYTFNPQTQAFATVMDFPLNYTDGGAAWGGCRQFEPWTDAPELHISGANNCRRSPIVSDIEFDLDGSMIIGIVDRGGHQWGNNNFRPDADAFANSFAAGGDLLRAYNDNGTFVLENAGTTPAGGGCGLRPSDGGIGGGEYYCGDRFGVHRETSMGAVAFLEGSGEIVIPFTDPLQYTSGGLGWFNNRTGEGPTQGAQVRGAELYNSSRPAAFGKANGLGDVEILCFEPPVEVGNFIWRDSNRNGVQDPGEPPIPGVTVELISPDGTTVLGTAMTDDTGTYYFSNGDGTDTPSRIYNIEGLTPDTPGYQVRIDTTQAPLAGLTLTPPNTGNDQSDSDATPQGTNAVVPFDTTTTTPINHAFDFGFAPPVTLSLGNLVWIDANNNGVVDAGESGVPNVTMRLFVDEDENCTPDGDPLATTTTDASGRYRFPNLGAGNYIVQATIPTGFVSSSGVPDETEGPFEPGVDPNSDTDNDDNGSQENATTVRSCMVTLADGGEPTNDEDTDPNSNLTVDFGLVPTGLRLGNLTFVDLNANGLREPTEPGIPNLTVNLYADGNDDCTADATTPVQTTVTDINGNYLFSGLTPGNYLVEAMTPPGFQSSSGEPGVPTGPYEPGPDPDDDTNNDDNGTIFSPAAVRSCAVTLAEDDEPTNDDDTDPSSNLTVDFGFVPTGLMLGNLVWTDTNENGLRDTDETGLPSITLNLYADEDENCAPDGGPLQTTTTNADGTYLFAGLSAGNYIVDMVLPPGARSTSGTPGIATGPYEPGPDPDNDVNNDDNGSLQPGTSVVRACAVTLADDGEPVDDEDTNPDSNLTVDFGVVTTPAVPPGPLTLGDTVFSDTNNNGVRDSNEQGIPDVPVELCIDADENGEPDGEPIATTTTDPSGNYLFPGLQPNTYLVKIAPPPGYDSSSGTPGSPTGPYEPGPDPDDDTDNDDNGSAQPDDTIRSGPVTLAESAEPVNDGDTDPNTNRSVDFGLVPSGLRLGNLVWVDVNENGLREPEEQGVPNVTVNLYPDANDDCAPDGGTPVQTTSTDTNGTYLFAGLEPGNYVVELVTPTGFRTSSGTPGSPSGPFEPSPDPDNDTNNDDNGTAVSPTSIRSCAVTMATDGEPTNDDDTDPNTNLTVDFGLVPTGLRLGDLVWTDTNENGLREPEESGVPNVTVNLYPDTDDNCQPEGAPLQTVQTGASGTYLFPGLEAGTYIVEAVLPAGTRSTSGTPGSESGPFEPAPDPENNVNNDDNGTSASPTTARSCGVTLAPDSEPVDDGDTDPNSNLTIDFGIVPLVSGGVELSLGNLVWNDLNNNGVVDEGEPGVTGATVNLYGDNDSNCTPDGTPLQTTTTGANGNYLFSGLLPGRYVVEAVIPAGYVTSTGVPGSSGPYEPAPGPDNDVDNDDNGTAASPTVVRTCTVVLTGGSEPVDDGDSDPNTNLTVDFGLIRPVSLGNLVWLDANNNGVADPGEPGQAGIPVTLYGDSNGDGIPDGGPVAQTTTNGDGLYDFPGLTPGTYIVVVTPPPGCVSSTGAPGRVGPFEIAPDPDNDRNNDDNGSTLGGVITSAPIVLAGNTEPTNDGDESPDSNLSVDFGVFKPASLGDFVWMDGNGNGLQDPGEPGVPNVTVTLHYPNGPVAATTTTDQAGFYQFPNLVPGGYFVTVTPPPGLTFSPRDAGDDTRDSDVDPVTGRTAPTSLEALENDPTWDAGLVPSPQLCLGNLVWNDTNNNGRVDQSETGFGGVPVVLFPDADGNGEPDGAPIAEAVTNGSGNYKFCSLPEGRYVVRIPEQAFVDGAPLAGYQSSTGNPPADSDVDNDDNGAPAGPLVTSSSIALTPNGEPTTDGDSDPNSNLTVDFGFHVPQTPVVGLTLQIADPPRANGDGSYNVPLTGVVSNRGSTPLTSVKVAHSLAQAFQPPAVATVVPGSVATTGGLTPNQAYDGATDPNLLTGADSLPVNGSGTVTFMARVMPNGYHGPFVNSAVASAEGASDVSNNNPSPDANGNQVANEGPDNVPVVLNLLPPGGADLEMVVDHYGDPSAAGNVFDFFLKVTNRSETPTNGPVTIVFTLPPSVRLPQMPGMEPFGTGWRCSGSPTITCVHEAPIRTDQEASVTVWTEIVEAVPTLTGTASVFYSLDPNPLNNTASDSIPPGPAGSGADLAIEASGGAVIDAGGVMESRAVVTNRGPVEATDVVVNTLLGPGMRYEGLTTSVGECVPPNADGIATCQLGTLPIGATVEIVLRAVAEQPGTVLQTFQVRSAGLVDPEPSNNAAIVNAVVPGLPAGLDSDGDSMTDAWEQRFGLNPAVADAHDDPDGDGLTNLQEFQQESHPRGFYKQLFAEGISNAFFWTELAMLNPSGTRDANVLITLMRDDGRLARRYQRIARMGRFSSDASVILGSEMGAYSTLIESDTQLAADRGMQWDVMHRYGMSGESGLASAATEWYFGEGATHGFQLFYLVENPDPARAAEVQVTYLLPAGRAPVVRTQTIAPHSRVTIHANADPELEAGTDVSAQVVALNGVPIVVERAMYRDSNGQVFGAGHAGAGATALSNEWFFAEGATGDFFDTFVLIGNPGTTPATVTARYQLPSGSTITKTYEVAPTSRRTISVEQEDPQLAAASMAITLTSTEPIVAERAMWWPGPGMSAEWYESHASLGATTTGTKWAVAGGSTGGGFGDQTFILVANQATTAGTAKVTVVLADGSSLEKTVELPATSRTTLDIGAEFPEVANRVFSTIIESVGATPVPLVVECARYSSPGQLWGAGASALATRLQ